MIASTKIEVVPYNSEWPAMFEKEKSIILNALRSNCSAIYHVGSTSIPGIAAKPKIDIVAVAKDKKQAISSLKKYGYTYKGEWNIPLKGGFTKRGDVDVNLHLFFDENHPEIELNLSFRDYLITHEDARNEYSALKFKILENEESQLIKNNMSIPVYTIHKRFFIDNILRKIGFNRLRVLKCLTENEQVAAQNFRKIYFLKQKLSDNAKIDFNDKNHEHFILYRGVDIVGYADLNLISAPHVELIETQSEEEYKFFKKLINEWISNR